MQFDLLIKGGEVVDSAAGFEGRLDVAISGTRVAAVDRSIPASSAARVIDATGCLVVPGLIDLHAHVFWGAGYFGIDADSVSCRSGVTTWVDAGSAGAFSMPAFNDFIVRPAATHIYAFINISYLGLAGLNYDEYCNVAACDVPLLERVAGQYRDVIRGIKVRMGTEGVCGGRMEPLMRALLAGEHLGLPVMAHISDAPPEADDILPLFRPGDIVTHAFTGLSEKIVDDSGKLRRTAEEARERGVLFDIGHGSGSFSFTTAEALAAVGFWPDTISTDLHQESMAGPNLLDPLAQEVIARVKGDGTPQFTLLTAMSKFLYLGMPLPEVVSAVTSRPAAALGLAGQIGTLRPGAAADVAILRVEEGRYRLYDIHGNERTATQIVRHVDTVVSGTRLPQKDVPPPPPWIELIDRAPAGL
jgi:dihydroorotase